MAMNLPNYLLHQNRCDFCSKRLYEDTTHELTLCENCSAANLKPKQYHCIACGVSVKWLNKLNKVKVFMKKKRAKVVTVGLPILGVLLGLFALEVFSFRTFLCVLAGLIAIPVVAITAIGVFLILTKVIYEIGSYVWCDKFGFDLPRSDYNTLGLGRWALGLITLTILPIIYFVGKFALLIIGK